MAATITGSATPRAQLNFANPIVAGLYVPATVDFPENGAATVFTNGTGASQINVGWADVRSYAATPTTLDLTALTAAATNTGAAAFAGIKILRIENRDAANAVTIGGAAATQFLFNGWSAGTTTMVVKAGQVFEIVDVSAAGMTVSGSIKSLKVDPGANTVSVGIVLGGI